VELRLEQGLGPRRFLHGGGRSLVADEVPVAQHPEVRADLIRDAADEAGLLIGRVPGLWVEDVHAREEGGLALRDFVHPEGAVHVTVHGPRVPRDRALAGEGELLRLVRHHAEPALVWSAADGVAVVREAGDPETPDAGGVVGVHGTDRHAGLRPFPLVAHALAV